MPITDVISNAQDLTLTVIADYPVSLTRLRDAYADPRQLERWWGPPTYPATVVGSEPLDTFRVSRDNSTWDIVGDTIAKSQAVKVRTLKGGRVIAGFAGSVADAITLFEKFEEKLDRFPGNLPKAAVELAKEWRSDRVLRRLEAMLIVTDVDHGFMLSGNGELIEPDDGILAIGSGGAYAQAAARALVRETTLSPAEIVQKALTIAGEICIYTNTNITVLEPTA